MLTHGSPRGKGGATMRAPSGGRTAATLAAAHVDECPLRSGGAKRYPERYEKHIGQQPSAHGAYPRPLRYLRMSSGHPDYIPHPIEE